MTMKAKKSKSKSKSKVADSSNDLIVNYKIPEEEESTETISTTKKKKTKKDSSKSPPPTPTEKPETSVDIVTPTAPQSMIKQKQRITKSIYFADSNAIAYLESMVARHPKNSLSSIIQQLVKALIEADNNERVIEIKAKIYL